MTELNKVPASADKAWSSEQEIVDYDVDKKVSNNKEGREKDISDEVSFYRQTKFSKNDAENITKKTFGDSALKRPDKLGVYKEISTLSPDIQNLWKKIENKRIKGKSQISYAHNLLKKEGIAEQEKTKLEGDIDALDERDAAFEDIENIILKEKNPNEILKAIQDLFDAYKNHQQEFQKQIEEQPGDIRAQAGLRRLNIGINILLNFKNAISNIINEEKNMTSKESSIIDSESKINEDEKNRVEGGDIEQKESLQEVIEASKSEIVNTQGDIQKEAENNDANIEQKSEGIEDPVVKDQIRTGAQKSNSEVISNGIRISKESLEKLNGIKNGQKTETEAKNPEIQALQNRADEELRSTESALNIFKNGKSDELDSLVDQLAAKMGVRGDLKSDGVRGYIKSGLEDQRKVLHRTRALLSQSKSPEEFYNKINNELDQLLTIKNNELGQIANEKNANNKGKEEKRVNNKYNFRKGVFGSYLPTKQEIKPEPTGEPQEPKAVDQKINNDAAQAENEDDLRKLRQQLSDERKKKIEAGDIEGAKELGIKIDEINYKVSFKESGLKDKKSGEVKIPDNKAQKPSKPVGEPTASVGTKSSFKKRDQLNADEAEAKNKTNGQIYANESLSDDMIDDLERIRNNKKQRLNEEKNNIEHSSKEVDDKKEEPKEKTAEEILREKNIEVYGGEEKLNQIFEKYKRLNELEDRGAYSEEHPLFSEWDALRVEIANINLEVIGKDRVVNLYKIQNKDEKIREYFNTKLDEPFEFFKKDIEKESPAEWAMRAATLIKYRNELKNCDWQKKDKYRNIPREKYVEIIKWLEQRIGMLNEKLPKKEGVSPEAALKDMSIDDFKKIEIEPEYKGGLPAVIEGEKVKTEMTAEQAAKVENVLNEFNLTAEDAEKIEGFKDLSYGQRLLALENLKQMTLRDVQNRALAEHDEKIGEAGQKYAKSKGWWGKAKAGAKMMWKGITKYYDIGRSKTRIHGELNKEDYGKILKDVVRGVKNEVVERNGKLEIQYVNNLENLSEEEKIKTQRFNEVATELSRLPQSLDQLPMGLIKDEHTRAQKRRHEELRAEYDRLLQPETRDGKINPGILRLLERQARLDLKKEGKDDSDKEIGIRTLTKAGEIENLIRLNRFFTENPDVEKELENIKSGKVWKSALKDKGVEWLSLAVGGYGMRWLGVKALTSLGVASSIGTGGIVLASAAAVGGGIGGWRGWRRAEESLREMDAQMRSEDFESKKSKNKASQEQRQDAAEEVEVAGKIITNDKGEKIESSGGKIKKVWELELDEKERREKNIIDADNLTKRFETIIGQINSLSDDIDKSFTQEGKRGQQTEKLITERLKLAQRLETRLGYTRRKLDEGLVNFGKSEKQAFNQMMLIDKLNLAVNLSEQHNPTTKTKREEPSPLEKRLEKFLDFKSREISSARKWHKLKQMGKGAAYGAGFSSVGVGARWLMEHVGVDIFWKSGGGGKGGSGEAIHSAVGAKSGGGELPPYEGNMPAGGGSEKIKSVIDRFNEDFRHHPEWKGNTLEQTKALTGLRQQLETAGEKNPDALKGIIDSAKDQLNGDGNIFIVESQEAQNLPGVEATGAGAGAGAGDSVVEHTAAAAGVGKTIDAVIGAKQDIVNSAVETASGKMNSIWKMIDHQLDQRGIFKGLTGTPEEIAAKKTYMIDYFKDIVAKDPKGFGLKDIDDLRVGQKVDLSKLFESHPRIGEIIRDTNVLPADKLASIFKHDQIIAEFHRLHPEVPIISENVDQIAAGHGDALLKKAVEQAASEHVQPSSPETIIQPESPKIPHQPASPYEDMLRNNIEGRIKEIQRLTEETIAERLNKIFDFDDSGWMGTESEAYRVIKNEIADNFLKRNLPGEAGELQQYLKELIKNNHSVPKIGETVEVFMKRVVGDTIQEDINKLLNLSK